MSVYGRRGSFTCRYRVVEVRSYVGIGSSRFVHMSV